MRPIVVLALVLVACGPDRRDTSAGHDASSSSSSAGPDQIVLRIPRSGGLVRAYRYPQLDSIVWTSAEDAAGPTEVLAFDGDAGSVAYVDRNGLPRRIDLRSGVVSLASRAKLSGLSSYDGWAIYGVGTKGTVVRLTPTGDWTYEPPQPARLVLPQADGSVLVVTRRDDERGVLRIRPPEPDVIDSAVIPEAASVVHAQAGDRVYFAVDSSLVSLRGRALTAAPTLRLSVEVAAIEPTPSGDRLFVASDSGRRVAIVDRYRDRVERTIELPGSVSGLRIDPLGRYVLARAAGGDSAWVIAVGTARVIGSVATTWRDDLPIVAPDGALLLAVGENVRIVDGETLRQRAIVEDGASDFWHLILWNGFRPRSGDLDVPVTFDSDTMAADTTDTTLVSEPTEPGDTTGQPPRANPPRAPIPRPAPPRLPVDTGNATPRSRGWVVSFAAFVSEAPARERAAAITVDGQRARVMSSQTPGTSTTVYRVVLGPYPTRADAERVGRQSRQSFWVYEGNP